VSYRYWDCVAIRLAATLLAQSESSGGVGHFATLSLWIGYGFEMFIGLLCVTESLWLNALLRLADGDGVRYDAVGSV